MGAGECAYSPPTMPILTIRRMTLTTAHISSAQMVTSTRSRRVARRHAQR